MLRSLKWRLLFYGAIALFAIILLMPTVTSQLPQWWTKIFPSEKIRLGLDLQGGMYLILGVEVNKAVESYFEWVKNNLRDDLKEAKVPVGKLEREKNAQVVVEFSGDKEKVNKLLAERQYAMMRELSSTAAGAGISRMVLILDSAQAEQIKKNAID